MFIFWSSGHNAEQVGFVNDNTVCSACGNNRGRCIIKDVYSIKLFFFLPVFWWTSWYLACPVCGRREKIDKETAMSLIASGETNISAADTLPDPFPEMQSSQSDPADEEAADIIRTITVKREKRFSAKLLPARILYEGNFLTEVRNGKEVRFQMDGRAHSIVLNMISPYEQWVSEPVPIPAGKDDITITIAHSFKRGGFDVLSVE